MTPIINEHGELQCPHCGSDFTHQEKVDVWWGNKHLTSNRNGYGVYDDGEDKIQNRGIVTIKFSCEGCDFTPKLEIYQYKGHTNLEWIL